MQKERKESHLRVSGSVLYNSDAWASIVNIIEVAQKIALLETSRSIGYRIESKQTGPNSGRDNESNSDAGFKSERMFRKHLYSVYQSASMSLRHPSVSLSLSLSLCFVFGKNRPSSTLSSRTQEISHSSDDFKLLITLHPSSQNVFAIRQQL